MAVMIDGVMTVTALLELRPVTLALRRILGLRLMDF